jgi:hypothetical protein
MTQRVLRLLWLLGVCDDCGGDNVEPGTGACWGSYFVRHARSVRGGWIVGRGRCGVDPLAVGALRRPLDNRGFRWSPWSTRVPGSPRAAMPAVSRAAHGVRQFSQGTMSHCFQHVLHVGAIAFRRVNFRYHPAGRSAKRPPPRRSKLPVKLAAAARHAGAVRALSWIGNARNGAM